MYYEKLADADGHLHFRRHTREDPPFCASIAHYHASFEIYLVSKGRFPVYLNGEARELCEGEIAFVDGLLPHRCGSQTYSEDFEVFVIVASKRYFGRELDTSRISPFTAASEKTQKILDFVKISHETKDEMNHEMRLGFTNYLLGMLLKYCEGESAARKGRSDLAVEIMRYIDTSFREEISLSSLAKKFGYTPSYISRNFNKYACVSLHEYINRLRYSRTRKMLETDKGITVSDAALACGFASVKTYYRIAKQYGMK